MLKGDSRSTSSQSLIIIKHPESNRRGVEKRFLIYFNADEVILK